MEKKFFYLVLVMFAFYSFFGLINFGVNGTPNNSNDFEFHFDRINTLDDRDYPILYHQLFSVFSFDAFWFYFVNVVLIIIVIPLLLYWITKTGWSIVLYFFGVSLPHLLLYGATYPQALVLVLFLVYVLKRRNLLLLFVFGCLAFFIHSSGVRLFVLVLFCELASWVWERFFQKKFMVFVKKWGLCPVAVLNVSRISSPVYFVKFVVYHVCFPLWFFAVQNLQVFYVGLIVLPFLFAVNDARVLSVVQLSLIILASRPVSEFKYKKCLLGLLVFYFFMFVLDFVWGSWVMASFF